MRECILNGCSHIKINIVGNFLHKKINYKSNIAYIKSLDSNDLRYLIFRFHFKMSLKALTRYKFNMFHDVFDVRTSVVHLFKSWEGLRLSGLARSLVQT